MSIRRVATGLALVLALLASTGLAVAAGKPGGQADKVNLNTATVAADHHPVTRWRLDCVDMQ